MKNDEGPPANRTQQMALCRWRRDVAVCLAFIALLLTLCAAPSFATTDGPGTTPVLQPDVQDAVIGLLGDVGFEREHPGGWAFRSISIAPSSVVFRLMGPGDAETSRGRAEVLLYPHGVRPNAPHRSVSFDIFTVLRTEDAAARKLVDRAVASVIQVDRGDFFTHVAATRRPPPPKRPGLRALPTLRLAAPGGFAAALCVLLLLWARRRRRSIGVAAQSGSPAAVATASSAAAAMAPVASNTLALSWLEVPGYALLGAMLVAAPLAAVVGTEHWPLAAGLLGAVALGAAIRRGAVRITGGVLADLWRVDAVVGVVCALLIAAWLRQGLQDDAFCHHAFVGLVGAGGLPVAAPGDSAQAVGYHVGFDVLAAALHQWMPLGGDVEWALDATSLVALLAVAAAAVALARRFAVSDAARGAAVAMFMLGSGPLWIGKWLPALAPDRVPWSTFWEGGTYMSLLSLAGRRASTFGFLATALFAVRIADGAISARGLTGRRGWGEGVLLGLLAGGASQAADELVIFVLLAVVVVACVGGRSTLRLMWRPLVVMSMFAPLSLFSGGFAAVMAGHLVGLNGLSGGALGGDAVRLTRPDWPSFHLGTVAMGTPDYVRIAALEFGPAAGAALLLWHPKLHPNLRSPRSLALVATLWLVSGLIAAQVLLLPSLGYRVDMHRLLEPGVALSLFVAPIATWRLLSAHPRLREAVALAVAWCHIVPAVGQAMDRADLVPVCVAAGLLALVGFTGGGLSKPIVGAGLPRLRPSSLRSAVGGVVIVAVAGFTSAAFLTPEGHDRRPPSLPQGAVNEVAHAPSRTPILATTRLGNLLLLHGHYLAAPHLRSDLNPLRADDHRPWLASVSAAELRRLGVRHFLLSLQQLRRLQRRLGDAVIFQPHGGVPGAMMPRAWQAWPGMRPAAPAPRRVVWGGVAYARRTSPTD